ncbi:MAG: hypothetical protein WCL16_01260 [bacterium]
MNTIYTTTITDEARRRGIIIEVLDPITPIFVLRHNSSVLRCYNSLTDRVGAATFHLAQNKASANRFLASQNFSVPAQALYENAAQALEFLRRQRRIVVKPAMQWGGRGVSVDVRTPAELRAAVAFARRYEDQIVLEQMVAGEDQRIILVGGRLVAAILRRPAAVTGDGRHTVWQLIHRQNSSEIRRDPSHLIPVNAETRRNLTRLGTTPEAVPPAGRRVTVRLTSNYHTGGDVTIITGAVDPELVCIAERVVQAFGLPIAAVDFLVDRRSGRHWIIEISPDMAISPPEGQEVARRFLDHLFPETASG